MSGCSSPGSFLIEAPSPKCHLLDATQAGVHAPGCYALLATVRPPLPHRRIAQSAVSAPVLLRQPRVPSKPKHPLRLAGWGAGRSFVNFSHDERPLSRHQSTKKCRLEDGSIPNAAPDTATFHATADFERLAAVGNRVERSLHQRAVGYSYAAVKIFCDKNGKVPRVPYR